MEELSSTEMEFTTPTTNPTTTTSNLNNCPAIISWWLSIVISLGIFAAGFILLSLLSFVKHLRKKCRLQRYKEDLDGECSEDDTEDDLDSTYHSHMRSHECRLRVTHFCEQLVTSSSKPGRILLTLRTLLSTVSWVIFLWHSTTFHFSVVEGTCKTEISTILSWIDLACNVYFLFLFILQMVAASHPLHVWFSLSTVVECCTIPNALITAIFPRRYCGLSFMRGLHLREYSELFSYIGLVRKNSRIIHIICHFFGMWMVGSGGIHLLEDLGNFWETFPTKNVWSFWECCYFLLVTMSTVGYGDYYSTTVLGRIFVCIFIMTVVAYFANSVPEMMMMFSNRERIANHYSIPLGQRHVLVCGNYSVSTLRNFLKGFYKSDMAVRSQSLRMLILTTEVPTQELKTVLRRFEAWVNILYGSPSHPGDLARAQLKYARDAIILNEDGDHDTDRIMQAMTIKSRYPRTRVLVLLHQHSNKMFLRNFPLWNNYGRDMVMCMGELKLGLIAQNSLAPGCSTLINNLLFNTASPIHASKTWRQSYEYGSSMKFYEVPFSTDFTDVNFRKASCIAYKQWGICLVALCVPRAIDQGLKVIINPDCSINASTMRAIVVATDEKMARKVQFFCSTCHLIGKGPCQCKKSKDDRHSSQSMLQADMLDSIKESSVDFGGKISVPAPNLTKSNTELMFDSTGSFYWTEDVEFNDACLNTEQASQKEFKDHVLICLQREPDEQAIGLCNFVMPLRSQSLEVEDLRDIVVLGSKEFIGSTEWLHIKNFARVYVVDGNPCNNCHLRAVNVAQCYSCVVMAQSSENPSELALQDKNALLCFMNIMALVKANNADIHITTELSYSANSLHFTTHGEETADDMHQIHLTEPYARGILVSNSFLYRCISSIYFNPCVLNLLRTLIAGEDASDVELMFGHGNGLQPQTREMTPFERRGCIIRLLDLENAIFHPLLRNEKHTLTYGELYLWALETHGILCMGLYRLHSHASRFVYSNPQRDTEILSTDKVYCFVPVGTLQLNSP